MENGYGQGENGRKYCWRCKVCGWKSPLTAQQCENPACRANLSMYGEPVPANLTPQEEERQLKEEEEARRREEERRIMNEDLHRLEEEERKRQEEEERAQKEAHEKALQEEEVRKIREKEEREAKKRAEEIRRKREQEKEEKRLRREEEDRSKKEAEKNAEWERNKARQQEYEMKKALQEEQKAEAALKADVEIWERDTKKRDKTFSWIYWITAVALLLWDASEVEIAEGLLVAVFYAIPYLLWLIFVKAAFSCAGKALKKGERKRIRRGSIIWGVGFALIIMWYLFWTIFLFAYLFGIT